MPETMKITTRDVHLAMRQQLNGRLETAAQLRCAEHGEPVVAVAIHGRENGWFDALWTTCCESLEKQARSILKQRC